MQTLNDTAPAADAALVQLLRQTPAWRKLQLMDQLNSMTRALAVSSVRQQHPAVSAVELHYLLAERLFGRDLASKLSGKYREVTGHAL